MVKSINMRKVIVWTALITLFAGLVWAVDTFLASANKQADEAAMLGANDELSTVQTTMVRPKKVDPAIDWKTIGQYNKRLETLTREYEQLLKKATAEKSVGKLSEATRNAGLASAEQYNKACLELAAVYEKGKCITRAKTARSSGQSRLKNAEMAFSESLNASAISAYNKQRGIMFDDSQENMQQLKTDANEQDVARLKSGMVPRLQQMAKQTASLATQVGQLLDQVRQTVGGGGAGAIAGCAKSVVTGAAEGPAGLVAPLVAMLDMIRALGSNLATTAASILSL